MFMFKIYCKNWPRLVLILAVFFFLAETPLVVLAFYVGETPVFNVNSFYDYANRSKVNAVLRHVGDKAVFYVDEDWWSSQASKEDADNYIAALSDEFDKVIYPRLTQVYGQEWSPGIDNEFKITVLLSRLQGGAGGYFNPTDESHMAGSNEREMIYLNVDFLNSLRIRGYLAHEFQHLISFYQEKN